MAEKLYTTIGDEMREFTDAEYAQNEIDIAAEKKAAAAKAKADKAADNKKQQILDRLGITNEELLAILS
jgi:hypothetical protein